MRSIAKSARKSAHLIFLLALALSAGSARAQHGKADTAADLTAVSLENLMNMEVRSASKKEQRLSSVPAAMHVITREDIRRSGLRSIPELLRLAPGLHVAHINGSVWSVSSRGFGAQYANKLLVLMDGRTLYSPVFAGVNWDVQDTLIEDIERIEIIRGPGATLWGVNAVNGVINIITRRARDTQGGLVTAGGGSLDRGESAVRYGGAIGAKAYYRVFAKYSNFGPFDDAAGQSAQDHWDMTRGGFRMDVELSKRDLFTVQGDVYSGATHDLGTEIQLTPPFSVPFRRKTSLRGGNVLGRWTRTFSKSSDLTVQMFFDRTDRRLQNFGEAVSIVDFEMQHRFPLGGRHDLMWGVGLRRAADETDNGLRVSFLPSAHSDLIANAFVQDEIRLAPDRLSLILGVKFERLRDHGFAVGVQPNLRLLWTPNARHSFWASVARAVQSPSRGDTDLRVNIAAFPGFGGRPTVLSLFGQQDYKPQSVLAFELGYRAQLSKRFSVDITSFYDGYKNLDSVEPGVPFMEASPAPLHLVIPLFFDNRTRGETYGVELSASWNVTSKWKLSASWSALEIQLHRLPGSLDPDSEDAERTSPAHQVQFHSFYSPSKSFELDTAMYFVGALPAQSLPSYVRVDQRFGWRATENVEVSVVGQNLLQPRHFEFNPNEGTAPTQNKRKIFAGLTWRF